MPKITSVSNDAVTFVCSLHHKKYREKYRKFIAEGSRTINTLLSCKMRLDTLYITENAQGQIHGVQPQKIILVADHVMQKMSALKTSSGSLAVFAIPEVTIETLQNIKTGIVLAQIQDPGNMGTLIRTAAAVDVKTVICIEGCDPWQPRVIQACAGSTGMVTIVTTTWQELVLHAKDRLCALVPREGQDRVPNSEALLVVGSEAHGIPSSWLKDCTKKFSLPMPGNTESLNAAVAGSIALYLVHVKQKLC